MSREVRTRAWRWQFTGEAAALVTPGGLPLSDWLDAGEAHVVKDAPHRSVYRVVRPGLDIHVKHYRADRRERWRGLIRPSKARAEYELGLEVTKRGVPTLEVLGYGESGRDSVLLTRTLAGAVSLIDFLATAQPVRSETAHAAIRQDLARALGRLLAAGHRSGVQHDDLHPGNILVCCTPSGPELYLIDLHAVRLGGPLGWGRSKDNLAMLDRWFSLRFSLTDRRRAWRAYWHSRDDLPVAERAGAQEMQAWTERSLQRFTSQLDRRCLGGNRHFYALRWPGAVGHAVIDLALEDVRRLAEAGPPPGCRALKSSQSSTVTAIDLRLAGEFRQAIFKSFPGGWRDVLASAFRPPPALRSYVLGHALRLRGVPTPRPLAVWHARRLGLYRDGGLVTELLPDAKDLLRFGRSPAGRQGRRRWRVIEDVADLIRRMHEGGVSHRDLKAANLLVSPRGWVMGPRGVAEMDGGRERVWVIDLVGASLRHRLTRHRRVRDLCRLHVSFHSEPGVTRADRLRFLRRYLGRAGDGGNWKGWWKEVERAGEAKVERNRRQGRVVG